MTSRCTICGQAPIGAVLRSLRGELSCAGHPTGVRCRFCGRPRGAGEPGWRELFATGWRCPTCGGDAVDTPDLLRRHVREVRQVTEALGFGLRSRVRVVFASVDELRSGVLGHAVVGAPLAYTELVVTGARSAEAAVVRVMCGLPAFAFGRALAHEVGHAWLAQSGARSPRLPIEEGMCELISYAWLNRAGLPYAEAVRDTIRNNPDPVYGGGFREVHAALRGHGLTALIDALVATGEPPSGTPVRRSLGAQVWERLGP